MAAVRILGESATAARELAELRERAVIVGRLVEVQMRGNSDEIDDDEAFCAKVEALLVDASKCGGCKGSGRVPIADTGDYDACFNCLGFGKELYRSLLGLADKPGVG